MQLSEEELNYRSTENCWSALECIEHLNLYGHFYLPEINRVLKKSDSKTEPVFKSGLLGNYFANSMKPKATLNKMKTFKEMNPIGSDLDKSSIDEFIRQQRSTIDLLSEARQKSLNRIKTSISISRMLKLKLGDTFRFLIFHIERHLDQAERESRIKANSKGSMVKSN